MSCDLEFWYLAGNCVEVVVGGTLDPDQALAALICSFPEEVNGGVFGAKLSPESTKEGLGE